MAASFHILANEGPHLVATQHQDGDRSHEIQRVAVDAHGVFVDDLVFGGVNQRDAVLQALVLRPGYGRLGNAKGLGQGGLAPRHLHFLQNFLRGLACLFVLQPGE